jgi:hypothetical protein
MATTVLVVPVLGAADEPATGAAAAKPAARATVNEVTTRRRRADMRGFSLRGSVIADVTMVAVRL